MSNAQVAQHKRIFKNSRNATCTNCKGPHPASYSQCPTLLAYLSKKAASKSLITNPLPVTLPPPLHTYPTLNRVNKPKTNTLTTQDYTTNTSTENHPSLLRKGNKYTNLQTPNLQTSTDNRGYTIEEAVEKMKTAGLDLFIRIIKLIQKHYTKCTTNLERVKATILIVKELEDGR